MPIDDLGDVTHLLVALLNHGLAIPEVVAESGEV